MTTWRDDEILEAVFRQRTLGQTMAQVALSLGTTRSGAAGMVKRVLDAAPQVEALRLRDHEVLRILRAVLSGKTTAKAMAKVFAEDRGVPVTRMAVLYLVWCVMNDTAQAGGGDVLQPDNGDVITWPAWWRTVAADEVAA